MGLLSGGNSHTDTTYNAIDNRKDRSQVASDNAVVAGKNLATGKGIVAGGNVNVTDGDAIRQNAFIADQAIQGSKYVSDNMEALSVFAINQNSAVSVAAQGAVLEAAHASIDASNKAAALVATVADKANERALDFGHQVTSDSLALIKAENDRNAQMVNEQNAFVARSVETAFQATKAESVQSFDAMVKLLAGVSVVALLAWSFKRK